jgi:soluble lytic murein transglycosylase-like protein
MSRAQAIPPEYLKRYCLKGVGELDGLLQVKPATANGLLSHGVIDPPRSGAANILCDDLKDPTYGIKVGAAYMAQLWHSGNYQTDYAYCTRPSVHTTLKPQESWSLQDKIAAYNGGPGSNSLSNTCPSDTFWHCPANGGYAETRQYVPKIEAYYDLLLSQGLSC